MLDAEASEMLKIFVESFQSHTPCLTHNILCHGLGMQWHQVQLANRSILNGSKRACLTRIGQEIYPAILYEESVTTANREENVGEPQQVANLMAHSLETAGKVYHMREKMKTAAKATATIKNHFDKRKRTAETNETSPDPGIIMTKLGQEI